MHFMPRFVHTIRIGVCICLSLFACLAGTATGHCSPAAQGSSPTFHYVFAHRCLPRDVHARPQLALALALSETNQELLLDIWKYCQQQYPKISPIKPTNLSVMGNIVDEKTAIALITLPQPDDMLETYYVCLITTFTTQKDNTLQASEVVYYTLEKSLDLSQIFGKPAPESAPTIIGAWTKDKAHLNFGPGPDPNNPGAFIRKVLSLFRAAQETEK